MAETKRRLPVLQSNEDDDGPPRPRWQWALIGAVAVVLCWLLLAMVATPLAGRVGEADPATGPRGAQVAALVVGNALALLLAALAGGYLVGRFGGLARVREAAVAGALAALAGSALALASGAAAGSAGAGAALVALVVGIGAGGGWLGGRLGVRARR
jgi:tRNA-(ms[2]io[6]A)-hydroxylase